MPPPALAKLAAGSRFAFADRPAVADALMPAEAPAANPALAEAPTASGAPAPKRRLSAPLAAAMARAARGSPAALARPCAPPGPAASSPAWASTGSAFRLASTEAGLAVPLSKTTSWLDSVRLIEARSGMPPAAKKSSVSLYCSTMPVKA